MFYYSSTHLITCGVKNSSLEGDIKIVTPKDSPEKTIVSGGGEKQWTADNLVLNMFLNV